MSGGDAAPYAWAPTKSGGRLAHSVDQPIRAQVREDEDSDRSSALSTPLSTPGRPGRIGAFHIQSSSEEEAAIVGDLFLRREEFVVQPHVPEEREQPEEHPQPEQRRQPGHQQPEDQQPGAENQPGRARCTCDRCDIMPNPYEDRCCQREPLNGTHIPDYEEGKCLLECDMVKHVISDLSAQLSWMNHMRSFGHTGDALNFDNMNNRNYRHHAYRNYINFMHGKLGRHFRKVIPACIVLNIRSQKPDPDGQYVGFVDVNEQGQPIDEADHPGL